VRDPGFGGRQTGGRARLEGGPAQNATRAPPPPSKHPTDERAKGGRTRLLRGVLAGQVEVDLQRPAQASAQKDTTKQAARAE
jgi:hypothetical protein